MQHTAFQRIGLTGGIASGKSTVGRLLMDRGFALIDADAVSRDLTAPGGAALPDIRNAFGAAYIAADGSMDRDKMRTLVFTQASAKAKLQAILHPLIRQAMTDKEAALKSKGKPLAIWDIPLLVESSSWRDQLDGVIVVDCSEQRQIDRVMARNGWSLQEAQAVIAAQASRQARLAAATWVIDNDSDDLASLATQVQAWQPF